MSVKESLIELPAQYSSAVFGQLDEYAKKIEKTLKVTIIARDSDVKVIGAEGAVKKAAGVLNNLIELARRGNQITEQNVDYALSLAFEEKEDAILEIDTDIICRTITGKPIKPKTLGQKTYVDEIRDKMIVFGLGPAGTGKTYLAMAMAITAFKNNEVGRIILTRPAIEAGEKLGFLPGDLQSKVDPYLRPLYDALYQIMGAESYLHNSEKGLIEVAPLAYMRGRTLDNAFIILDEAQNTTPAQNAAPAAPKPPKIDNAALKKAAAALRVPFQISFVSLQRVQSLNLCPNPFLFQIHQRHIGIRLIQLPL